MSTKHYFPETAVNTLVPQYLKALVVANPGLALIESERVILNRSHDSSKVSVISGGGSGHEPAWSGYAGDGLLSAVACGDIFASPSMKQVMSAIAAAPSDQGTILMITNYTGDKLHFGLAAERALASGLSKKVVVLPATDDVSIGKSRSGVVGRRGMPGHMITMKILGAAAAKNVGFEKCVAIGKALNSQLVSIGSALDHCHVPGRQNHESIPNDVCIVGAGIHNEPGAQRISPFPSVEELISNLLALLCDQNDAERAFVQFGKSDDVVLLVNNYGGMSNLEIGALTQEILEQLKTNWSIKPVKIYSGIFESSLNGPGFSISLCNLSTAAKDSDSSVREFIKLLNAPTTAPHWPSTSLIPSNSEVAPLNYQNSVSDAPKISEEKDIKIDPILLEKTIRTACDRAIASEPNLTKWDMIMGDGDCGEAVEGVSKAIVANLAAGTAKNGSLLEVLYSTIASIDDMGGTLGAIFGIFLSAFTHAIIQNPPPSTTSKSSSASTSAAYAAAVSTAATKLKQYTGAREGDRTVMDVLLPFADTFAAEADFGKAVRVAREKAEETRKLGARFGRASYVGIEEGGAQEVPDPGAWALMEMLEGLQAGMA